MGFIKADEFLTIHNYIDTDAMILRKARFLTKKGEKLLIPINMRDGSAYLYRKRKAGVELLRPSWGRAAHEPESGVFHAFHGTVPVGK